jgi:hypothetical protein
MEPSLFIHESMSTNQSQQKELTHFLEYFVCQVYYNLRRTVRCDATILVVTGLPGN